MTIRLQPPDVPSLTGAMLLDLFGARGRARAGRRRIADRALAQVTNRAISIVPRAVPVWSMVAAALVAFVACAGGAGSARAASVHLANIVPVAVAENDFELAPANLVNTWAQQGVRVTQIAGDGDIWLASGLGNGSRSWFPDSGDEGWTRITLDSGANFDGVSFFGGSGWITPPQTMYFELADGGVVVLSGTLDATFGGSWFGFAGGDFDEVRVRASQGMVTGLLDCPSGGPGGNAGCNFAWLDDVRVGPAEITNPVPLPPTLGLLALALAMMKLATGPGSRSAPMLRWRSGT